MLSIRLSRDIPPGGRRLTDSEARYVREQNGYALPYAHQPQWIIDWHPIDEGFYQLHRFNRGVLVGTYDAVDALACSQQSVDAASQAITDLALLHADLLAADPDLAVYAMRVREVHGLLSRVWNDVIVPTARASAGPELLVLPRPAARETDAPAQEADPERTFVFEHRVIGIEPAAQRDVCTGCVFEPGATSARCAAVLQAATLAGAPRCTTDAYIYAERRATRPGRPRAR